MKNSKGFRPGRLPILSIYHILFFFLPLFTEDSVAPYWSSLRFYFCSCLAHIII